MQSFHNLDFLVKLQPNSMLGLSHFMKVVIFKFRTLDFLVTRRYACFGLFDFKDQRRR